MDDEPRYTGFVHVKGIPGLPFGMEMTTITAVPASVLWERIARAVEELPPELSIHIDLVPEA